MTSGPGSAAEVMEQERRPEALPARSAEQGGGEPRERAGRNWTRRWGRRAVLAVGCVGIVLWQMTFSRASSRLDDSIRLRASSGIQSVGHDFERFLYFYHYLGLFPVATELPEVEGSREGAERVFAEHGETLVMERGYTIRYGDLGKLFLYLPGIWQRGSLLRPSVRAANALAWTVSLVLLFVAFWHVRRPVLGLFAVVFLGSNPFQLYEVYGNENVFGWQITTCVLLLALHLPLLMDRAKRSRVYLWALPVVTGLVLVTVRQVRPEPAALILSAAMAYVTVSRVRWRTRVALVVLLGAAFVVGERAWQGWFDAKFAEARRRVVAAGGHPYDGPRTAHHRLWHVLWCGLGDFGQKYGYAWSDKDAIAYARSVIQTEYGEELPPWDGETMNYETAFWDEAEKYRRTPLEHPLHTRVLREKIVHDITHDPLWYLGVLGPRAWRILAHASPVSLAWGQRRVDLPMHGLVAVLVLALLMWARAWGLVKIIVFALPTSLTALLVYSKRGMPLYSCYHLFAAAMLAAFAAKGVWRVWRRQHGTAPRAQASAQAGEE